MPSTMFMAILPQKLEQGNKVLIRGTLRNAPEEFSINFVNEISQNPQNIAYHFKWILGMDTIVQNCKKNGNWMEEIPIEFEAFDGRLIGVDRLTLTKNAINDSISNSFSNSSNDIDAYLNSRSYSILGPTFALEFVFQDDGIYVYLVYEDGRNLITHYELECQLSDIQSLQVWGDVQKINQLTFTYD